MEINSWLNPEYVDTFISFHFEKKNLQKLPKNRHNFDLTKKIGSDEFAEEKLVRVDGD